MNERKHHLTHIHICLCMYIYIHTHTYTPTQRHMHMHTADLFLTNQRLVAALDLLSQEFYIKVHQRPTCPAARHALTILLYSLLSLLAVMTFLALVGRRERSTASGFRFIGVDVQLKTA